MCADHIHSMPFLYAVLLGASIVHVI